MSSNFNTVMCTLPIFSVVKSNLFIPALLLRKAVRVVNFKSPVAHTEPILMGMNQLKFLTCILCQLLKLYYKLYRNELPAYFENFLLDTGASPGFGRGGQEIFFSDLEICMSRSDMLRMAKPCA